MTRSSTRWQPAALSLTLALSGCAIQELKADNAARQARIDQKAQVLGNEQQMNQALLQQQAALQQDLRTRQMTAYQLSAQLDALKRLNEKTVVATPADTQRRDERARALTDLNNQSRALEKDNTASEQEKTRKLDALKEKTRKMLDLLLKG